MAQWNKGTSGNPKGRPKRGEKDKEIRALARTFCPKAVKKLVKHMDDKDPRVSIQACIAVLDRGYGRPPQAIQLEDGDGMGPVVVIVSVRERLAGLLASRAAKKLPDAAPGSVDG